MPHQLEKERGWVWEMGDLKQRGGRYRWVRSGSGEEECWEKGGGGVQRAGGTCRAQAAAPCWARDPWRTAATRGAVAAADSVDRTSLGASVTSACAARPLGIDGKDAIRWRTDSRHASMT